jgi:hypothetical protein
VCLRQKIEKQRPIAPADVPFPLIAEFGLVKEHHSFELFDIFE